MRLGSYPTAHRQRWVQRSRSVRRLHSPPFENMTASSPVVRRVLPVVAGLALVLSCTSSAGAQRPAATGRMSATEGARTDTACVYERCALGIAPRWNGLAVVRGRSSVRVANLHFFWPRDVSRALAGPDASAVGADSAAAAARGAVRLRRMGAALTDGGVALLASAAVGAIASGRARRSDRLLAGAGAAMLGVSVPLQFAADGALSRAVWWHNARYTR